MNKLGKKQLALHLQTRLDCIPSTRKAIALESPR
jgi:hypothetical protein